MTAASAIPGLQTAWRADVRFLMADAMWMAPWMEFDAAVLAGGHRRNRKAGREAACEGKGGGEVAESQRSSGLHKSYRLVVLALCECLTGFVNKPELPGNWPQRPLHRACRVSESRCSHAAQQPGKAATSRNLALGAWHLGQQGVAVVSESLAQMR